MNEMKPLKIPENYKYISAFLTMRCNLSCDFCLNAFDKSFNRKGFEEISGKEWVDALNRIESREDVPVTFSGGEPFLHKDFIYIINHLKPELNIDILTNLQWGEKGLGKFISEVNPERVKRNAPYASIRVSYHPEQMDVEKLTKSVKKMKDAGFNIGIWEIAHPKYGNMPKQFINRYLDDTIMNKIPDHFRNTSIICKNYEISFRLKEYEGEYKGELYGDYSKYPGATSQKFKKNVSCKTSELLIGPNGDVYRCHGDLYTRENATANIKDPDFEIRDIFRPCNKFGFCNPCDVKVKTNYKQQSGHTSVEIKNIK